ncbi:MAG: acyl carrier protein [Clostridia bacterium]|jgi:acyl carrier protein|nr:acyl carrier protein [Clostridia bacterium]MDD4572289.1 acyl carrier protein [Clostridia bacterium]
MTVLNKVAEILADHTDVAVEEITMETNFEKLGLDSLDMVDLVMQMEEEFDVKIAINQQLAQVSDLVKLIEGLQN